jgi:hypothetical protein
MLALKADLRGISWKRWRTFGMSHNVVILCLTQSCAFYSASLKVAEVDLATARNHIQQFKEISQANEEALASLNTTYDEYKSTTEAQLTTSWVFPLCLRVSFDSNSRIPAGPTRRPSDLFEDRGAGA